MIRLIVAFLFLAGPALALPHGGATPPISGDPSPTSIFMSWTTTAPSITTGGGCDITPGSYAKAAIIVDGGAALTAHQAIVAGLAPNTLYFCKGIAGGVNQLFQITTLAAPITTPLVSVSFGATSNPLNGQNTGDTYGNTVSSDGKVYLTEDDGASWLGSGANGQAFPMVMGTIDTSFIGTNVNTFSNFTVHGEPPKLFGVVSYQGVLYSPYSNLCSSSGASEVCSTGSASFFGQMWGGILKSPDHGVTWANWQNPTSYSAGGTVPSPYNGVTMFDGASGCSQSSFITYGADNGSALPSIRVDNADAYAYLICGQPLGDAGTSDGSQFNADSIYMARIPWASLPSLDSTKIQYFIGGSNGNSIDGSLDGAWQSTYSGAVAIATNPGHVSGYSFVHYVPSVGRYVWLDWYWNNPGSYTSSTWLIYEAPHPWGPWTLISTTTYNPQGWYAPAAYMPSTLIATPNGTPMQLLVAGSFTSGSCPICFYQLNVFPVTLNTH
jgi:hypothetical protein